MYLFQENYTMYKVGIDLGGTKIEGIVLTPDGTEVFRKRVPTLRERGYDYIVNAIAGLYRDLCETFGNAPHTFGIGTPGAISSRTGTLKNSNTICINGKPFLKDLESLLGRKIAIQNDANCFSIAEALQGAGRGHDVVFGVIMGTGCGGGIVVHGKALEGLQGIAGEWGHISIDPNGTECYCGNRGCIETMISGHGLEQRYLRETGKFRPLRELEADYYTGTPRTVEFMEVFFRDFGRALGGLISILDPDVVVLGGGVSKFDAIYDKGVEQVKHYVFNDELLTPILKHRIGDSAGVIGAALIGI